MVFPTAAEPLQEPSKNPSGPPRDLTLRDPADAHLGEARVGAEADLRLVNDGAVGAPAVRPRADALVEVPAVMPGQAHLIARSRGGAFWLWLWALWVVVGWFLGGSMARLIGSWLYLLLGGFLLDGFYCLGRQA